jgi:hypothetical protein
MLLSWEKRASFSSWHSSLNVEAWQVLDSVNEVSEVNEDMLVDALWRPFPPWKVFMRGV